MAIPYLLLPMPSTLSNAFGPLDGFGGGVVGFHHLVEIREGRLGVGPVEDGLVARAGRPLLLLTTGVLALDSQISRCQGSSTIR
jgi:hypothetical protein